MAILQVPADLTVMEEVSVLKIKSVKQLPQVVQVPTMYSPLLHFTTIRDSHLVIQALRTDLVNSNQLLLDAVEEVNSLKAQIYTILQDHEDRLVALGG